ncbi:TetR/AcrR family transcriptional regulator [Nonomuraea sp. NPDC050328]|uniref:TetR/AcrR family transcriptional regulator n=1 Tax=Nonomuraea sp. NPDC050328 TaxID=3364361 RepID=UPI0037A8DA5E
MSNLDRVRQAAVRLFAERGFAATGIREIGKAVGLNSGTLYHYASGKEELLVGIMRAGMEELLRVGREAVGLSTEPTVQLGRLVVAHVTMEAVNPLTSTVNDREIRSLTGGNLVAMVEMRDEYEALFQGVLEEGVRRGDFRITDVGVTRLALVEMCNGVAHWFRPGGRLSISQVQDLYLELACRLVGARAVVRAECGPEVRVSMLGSEPRDTAAEGPGEAAGAPAVVGAGGAERP